MTKNIKKFDNKGLILSLAILGTLLFVSILSVETITAPRGIIITGLCFTIILVFLTLVNREKYWWASRGIALLLVGSALVAIIFIILSDISLKRREIIALIFSFCILIIPGTFFVLWGNPSGKIYFYKKESSYRKKIISLIEDAGFVIAVITGLWLIIEYIIYGKM